MNKGPADLAEGTAAGYLAERHNIPRARVALLAARVGRNVPFRVVIRRIVACAMDRVATEVMRSMLESGMRVRQVSQAE